jgi:spore coat polysaccharide biosynthesis protein SpsF (cytidylyltransferase family)
MTICHAFIQARMSSTRFPGKVLETIAGLPAIVYMARRAARARLISGLTVVTSTDASDDALQIALEAHGIAVFRGALNDVLARFGAAAEATNAQEIIRLTGDCPLIDPDILDRVIQLRRDMAVDYASNIDPPSFPDGLDCEVFSHDALKRALREALQAREREHVTLWMRGEASGLRRANLRSVIDASALRLTVDYPDDLAVVRELVAALPDDGDFDYYDLLRVLDTRQDLLDANRHARNEALLQQSPTELNT